MTTHSGALPVRRRGSRRTLAAVLSHVPLSLGSLFFLVPLYWQISTSLKTPVDTMRYPPTWLPWPPQWQNYAELMQRFPFPLFIRNSAFITGLVILGTLLSGSLAGYGFARLRMPGRDLIFMVLMATLMVPGSVLVLPQFLLYYRLGWVNSFRPLIVPAFFGSPLSIFLFRQFLMTIPLELEDAARIDGAGYLRTYAQIVLPLIRPALLAVGIYTFLGTWNDFFGPLIYLSDKEKYTVAVALRFLQATSGRTGPQTQLLMAASVLAFIPPIVIFLIAQRQFIQGTVITGVKG